MFKKAASPDVAFFYAEIYGYVIKLQMVAYMEEEKPYVYSGLYI
jgi:hypothetical protein